MADNVDLPASAVKAAADEVSYSGDTAKLQLFREVGMLGTEGSKTVVEAIVLTASGSLTAQEQGVTLTLFGHANVTWQITGTWTATVTFEASNDNTNWTSIYGLRAGDNIIATTVVNSANNDIYRNTTAGFAYVRLRCSAFTSGTIVVTGVASARTSGVFLNFPLPPGTNTLGVVGVTTVKPDGTNTQPSLDVAARAGFFKMTDGTNLQPTMDVAARRGYVQVTDGTNSQPAMDAAARRGYIQITDGTTNAVVDASGGLEVAGSVAHGSSDAGAPIKIGLKTIAHGTNPTQVAAAYRTDWYANRAGIPWVMGGHPAVKTVRLQFTAAQTDVAVATVASGLVIVVTALQVTLDNASTVFPLVRIGFGATNTPTTTGVLAAHGGVPAGGGFSRGDGSGMLGVGADGEDVRITTVGAATGNGVEVVLTYYTIES